MANRVEDAPYGTPSAHHQKQDENAPELHDESIEEDSDEEEFEFPPEDVKDEPAQSSRFITRGPADARAVSLNTVRRLEASKGQQTQNQTNNQTVSQKKTPLPPRQIDAKRYAK